MTTKRREITLEGSDDQVTWKPYEFRWKPGDVRRAPPFIEPHMPRVDWQMWFAALDDYRRNTWLLRMMVGLIQGSKPVVGLLATDPFRDHPPQYVRAMIADYHFTTPAERRATGAWWRKDNEEVYAPVLSRDMLRGSPTEKERDR